LAPLFLAPPFFAPPLAPPFFAPPFFAVGISLLLLSSKFLPYTQDTVAWLLLCTSLIDTQDIVVYRDFAFSCQRFFLSAGGVNRLHLSLSLKSALEAGFMFLPAFAFVCEIFCASERTAIREKLFLVLASDKKGSGSQFQGGCFEAGSQSPFRGDVTKLASGACFEVCDGRKSGD
jgi:hypothetical protein